jgi:hypothetical protein
MANFTAKDPDPEPKKRLGPATNFRYPEKDVKVSL